MRLKLVVSYDGRPYHGWQSQPSGRGVQDLIEKAMLSVCGRKVILHGAGRTDAGVHALGQVAHADFPESVPASLTLQRALNACLPDTIRILKVVPCPTDFHSRFSARGKIYRYEIFNHEVLPPLLHGRCWQFKWKIDRDKLAEALEHFAGTHDFRGFAASRKKPLEDAVRTIESIRLTGRPGGLLRVTFQGDGFLYKMVRLMVGQSMRVAAGREPMEKIPYILQHPLVARAETVAPAWGLYLVKVYY